jgi:hypothetical protein
LYDNAGYEADMYARTIDANLLRVTRRKQHVMVSNYLGFLDKMRVLALYHLGQINDTHKADETEMTAESWATSKFLNYLSVIYTSERDESGIYYVELNPFSSVAANPNLVVDTSLGEYLNCLLTQVGFEPIGFDGYVPDADCSNIVNPSEPLSVDFETHVYNLHNDLYNALQPGSVNGSQSELLTALQMAYSMQDLCNALKNVYVSYNSIQRMNGRPEAGNMWDRPWADWADRCTSLEIQYVNL